MQLLYMPSKLTSRSSWLFRYAAALAAVGAGLLLRLGLTALVGPGLPTYVTFYPAVMLVALLAGFGPALLATAAAALVTDFWLLPPVGLGIQTTVDAVGLALFSGMGVLMSVVAELYRRAEAELRRHHDHLQEMVAARTAELNQANISLGQRVAELHGANEALDASRKAALNLMEDALQARKQAEAASVELRNSSEQRRLALEAADLGAWDYHFQTGEVFWDERCREMWGIPEAAHVDYTTATDRIHPDDRAGVDAAVQEALTGHSGGGYHREFRVMWPDGSVHWISSHGHVYFEGEGEERHATRFIGANLEITAEKEAREALRQSEQRVRMKLEAILAPEGELGALELADLLDVQAVQSLMDDFHELAPVPMAIIDLKGQVLVGVGWQDICTQYHRVHPETCKYCIESDTVLSAGVAPGQFKLYKCKNNMWDVATPILVGGRHVGNLFIGQFFFEGETVDREVFRSQARQYGFKEEDYLAALDKVPRLSRPAMDRAMAYFSKLADMLSKLSYSNIKLAHSLTEGQQKEKELRQLNRTLKALSDSNQAMLRAQDESQYLDEICRIIVQDCGHAMVWIGFAEDDEARSVRPAACAGFEEGYLKTLNVTWADTERGRGPTGTAIRTGKPCHCKNMLTDPAFAPWREQALERGYASSLVLPLLAGGTAFGAVSIYSKQPDPFSEDEVRLLSELSDDLAYGITALRVRVERERAEHRSELLADTASQLLATDTPQRVVEDLGHNVLAVLDCQVFFNYLVDERAGRLHLNACAGIPAEEARKIEWLDYGSAVCGCAARDGTRIVAEDIQQTPDPRAELVKSYGVQAYACHPLIIEGRVLGTLSFGARTRAHFTGEDLSLMKAVADQVAMAMERQRARAALQKANDELEQRVAERTTELHAASLYARSLIEAGLEALVTISPEGKITDVNRATEEVTGVSRERLVGTNFSDYFTEPNKAEEGYRRVLAEGLVRDYPLTIRHASGRTTDVLYHATVYRDEAGQVQGVFAAARDITERKQAERRRDFTSALLALFAQKTSARDYLKSVVEVTRQWTGCQALGIRIADEQGEIPYAAWAGFEPEFLELESRLSLHRDNCCCIRAISQAFEQPDRALLTPNGSYRCDDSIAFVNKLPPEKRARYRGNCMKFGFASLAIIPVRYREEVVGAVHLADRRPGQFPAAAVEFLETMTPLIGEAVHRFQMEAELARHRDQLEVLVRQRTQELTDANARLQQTADDLQRSNRDLEQFAYVASHDLQEPLRAVGGYVKLLQHRFPDKLDAKARDYIAGAFDGATRMERLISDLLAYSRVGTRGGAFAPADLDTVLEQSLRNLETGIAASQAAITRDPLPTLTVDATQMMQLFQNLIGNAIKFHGESPPRIHVGAQKQEGRWVFSVRDNGIGIEPQYYERIFHIFQRLHTRKAYSGTGIGLAICKKIAERHAGMIWVESQPGQGSTFYFSMPEASA